MKKLKTWTDFSQEAMTCQKTATENLSLDQAVKLFSLGKGSLLRSDSFFSSSTLCCPVISLHMCVCMYVNVCAHTRYIYIIYTYACIYIICVYCVCHGPLSKRGFALVLLQSVSVCRSRRSAAQLHSVQSTGLGDCCSLCSAVNEV